MLSKGLEMGHCQIPVGFPKSCEQCYGGHRFVSRTKGERSQKAYLMARRKRGGGPRLGAIWRI